MNLLEKINSPQPLPRRNTNEIIQDSLCNHSYDSSIDNNISPILKIPTPRKPRKTFFNEHTAFKFHEIDSFMTVKRKEDDWSDFANITAKFYEKNLKRPCEPPPLPPPLQKSKPILQISSNIRSESNLRNPSKSNIQHINTSILPIGFENFGSCSKYDSQFSKGRYNCFIPIDKPEIRKQKNFKNFLNEMRARCLKPFCKISQFKSRRRCDMQLSEIFRKFEKSLVFLFSLLFFFLIIIFITLFQKHVHDFYKNMSNFETTQNVSNLSQNLANFSKVSEVINNTVLFCNSPFLSYQINNLVVLPFSLCLTMINLLFNKFKNKNSRKKNAMMCNRDDRFVLAALFCIITNEIFKTFESSLLNNNTYFNSTADLFSYISTNLKIESSSNSDFIAIGFGLQPAIDQRTSTTTIRPIMVLGPVTLKYIKPELPRRIEHQNISKTRINIIKDSIFNKLNSSNSFIAPSDIETKVINITKNKWLKNIIKSNNSLLNSSFEDTFTKVKSQEISLKSIKDIYQSNFELPQFQWTILTKRLERIAIVTFEVFLIGMRCYPLFTVLETESRICTILTCVYVWCDMFYQVLLTGLCEGLRLNINFDIINDFQNYIGQSMISYIFRTYHSSNKKPKTNFSYLFSTRRIIFTIIKSVPHFFCLTYIAVLLSIKSIKLILRKLNSSFVSRNYHKSLNELNTKIINYSETSLDNTFQNSDNFKIPKNSKDILIYNTEIINFHDDIMNTFEQKYVNKLFKREIQNTDKYNRPLDGNCSVFLKLINLFWSFDQSFKFSPRVLCIFTSSFTVVYYLTCFTIFYGSLIIDTFSSSTEYKMCIFSSAIISGVIVILQLYFNLKNMKLHLIALYKGDNKSFNYKKAFKNKLILNNFSYAGYSVVCTCFGFFVIFLFMSFINFEIFTNILFGNTQYVLFILYVLLPFLLTFLLLTIAKKLFKLFSKIFCFNNKTQNFLLNYQRFLDIFAYFKFFYDIYTGIALCFTRIIKSVVFLIFFIPRMDYWYIGNVKKRVDTSFSSYLNFLHSEANHTNPTLIAFCQILNISINKNKTILLSVKKKRILNRWFLLITLIKNKELRQFRYFNIKKK